MTVEEYEKYKKNYFSQNVNAWEYVRCHDRKKGKHVLKCRVCGSMRIAGSLSCLPQCLICGKEQRTEQRFVEKFRIAYGEYFDYLGGYPNQTITVRCKKCGCERERTRSKIFTRSNISCPECGNNRKGIVESMCVVCGALFEQHSPQQTMCSDCHKDIERAKRSAHSRLREAKAKQNGKVDYTITLSRLMERDGNVCALCGCEVNESDYVYVGDAFIAGNDYPSIDHIKPLSKGGLHQWDNVQLAHRLCNSLKRDK